jgi:hypothetical protein
MDLTMFPFDQQICKLEVESCRLYMCVRAFKLITFTPRRLPGFGGVLSMGESVGSGTVGHTENQTARLHA